MLGFSRNGNNPLPGPGLLIADEMSMTDLPLAYSLFAAIPESIKVVLVGDADQLPSVGPGNVLRDLIASGRIPVTRLDYVYRQAEGSGIAYLAEHIRQGALPKNWRDLEDVEVITVEDRAAIAGIVVEKYKEAAERFGGVGSVLALAPMYEGSDGVKALNEALRATMNPAEEGKQEQAIGGKLWRIDDKVMVVKNNYDLEVFNGDVGLIVGFSIKPPRGIHVQIAGGGRVSFNEEDGDTEHLVLAYACTVHRGQGGEAPAVIMVMSIGHKFFAQRNLIYTGITRAKKRLILVGQEDAIRYAVKKNDIAGRNTRLAELIRGKEGVK